MNAILLTNIVAPIAGLVALFALFLVTFRAVIALSPPEPEAKSAPTK